MAGIAANGKDRERGLGKGVGKTEYFNFLATNSKPQIAKINIHTQRERVRQKRGVECMFCKPKSEPSCKVDQKTTATTVLLYLNGFWQLELGKSAKCNNNNCRYRYGSKNKTPTASKSATESLRKLIKRVGSLKLKIKNQNIIY